MMYFFSFLSISAPTFTRKSASVPDVVEFPSFLYENKTKLNKAYLGICLVNSVDC